MQIDYLSILKKTNYFIFKTKQRKVAYKREAIRINNEILEQKPSIKFLGVLIDENFDWKEHVNAVANKISKSIGIIYWSSTYLSQTSLLKLDFSLVYPYLFYGNLAWGGTYPSTLERLCVLQKWVIRIITKSEPYAYTSPIFYKYGLLDIVNIHSLQVGLLMFLFNKKLLPQTFHTVFQKSSVIHCYPTRSASNYGPKKCRINIWKFTISY